jgi:hypothetical protein
MPTQKFKFGSDKEQRIRELFVMADECPSELIFRECDELLRRGVAEIQSAWTEADFERHAAWDIKGELTIPQVEIHHICDDVLNFSAVG